MEKATPRYTLASLAALLGGECEGDPDTPLDRPVSAGDQVPTGVTFAESEAYLVLAESTDVGAIIVGRETRPSSKPLIRVDQPRLAFFHLLHASQRPLPLQEGIHQTAIVSPQATVDQTASIGAYVFIEQGATIGPAVRVFPFCFVGANCTLGEGCVLYPHVVLYRDVVLGARTVVHSGAVVGADGFGYVWDGSQRVKVPQVGRVTLASDVEIGANTTIDRATAGETRIGKGTKIDNLVQIAHNVNFGEHGVVAAQTGISGSSKVGDRVMLGGNVGIADHATIGDDVFLGARSAVSGELREPGSYLGFPARPVGPAKRAMLLTTKLPELLSRIRELERKVSELEKEG